MTYENGAILAMFSLGIIMNLVKITKIIRYPYIIHPHKVSLRATSYKSWKIYKKKLISLRKWVVNKSRHFTKREYFISNSICKKKEEIRRKRKQKNYKVKEKL